MTNVADLKIIVEDGVIQTQVLLLVAISPMLRAILQEQDAPQVHLPMHRKVDILHLLQLLTKGKVKVNLWDKLALSNLLMTLDTDIDLYEEEVFISRCGRQLKAKKHLLQHLQRCERCRPTTLIFTTKRTMEAAASKEVMQSVEVPTAQDKGVQVDMDTRGQWTTSPWKWIDGGVV
jgi:hypothetical protein